MKATNFPASYRVVQLLLLGVMLIGGCSQEPGPLEPKKEVPRAEKWGIYILELSTENVELIYSTKQEINGLDMDNAGGKLAFSLKRGAEVLDTTSEVYTISINGTYLKRLTNNLYFDAYPSFSPDGSRIVFLSKRNGTLDLYVMNSDGSEQQKLYDSGGHDADVNWGSNGLIFFTRDHQIWSIKSDGTDPQQVTKPPNSGEWGTANLPIGDYDPRLNPDGSKIVFERLENPNTPHGGYNIFVINADGTGETRLTNNSYTQGMPGWSHSGDKIVYIVAAINDKGKFDIYMMNADGTKNHSLMPDYFPDTFLARHAIFSKDDAKIVFIAEWWE